jgi:hypothetical protein
MPTISLRLRYPADPPTVEEIIAVCAAGDNAHGRRLRGLIVILGRAALRTSMWTWDVPSPAPVAARCRASGWRSAAVVVMVEQARDLPGMEVGNQGHGHDDAGAQRRRERETSPRPARGGRHVLADGDAR